MLSGGSEAKVSSNAIGRETFRHDRYEKSIRGNSINVFNIVGLGDGNGGIASAEKGIEALYRLMRGLDDGVSLLVYVVRGPRLSDSIRKNYELFYEIFCEKKVPIVLVITGLEHEEDMDSWWKRNEATYKDENMTFADASCITAIKGKKDIFAQEFEESRGKVEELIWNNCSETTWVPPAGGKESWLGTILVNHLNTVAELLHLQPIVIAKSVYNALMSYGDLEEKQARLVANRIYNETNPHHHHEHLQPWTPGPTLVFAAKSVCDVLMPYGDLDEKQARMIANRIHNETTNPHHDQHLHPEHRTTSVVTMAKSVYHTLMSYGDLDEKQARNMANRIRNEIIHRP